MITNRRWTIALVLVLLGVFGLELATHSVGNDDALLKLGAVPDNGELQGQYWRLAKYSFLHFNGVHLLVNASLLFWIGGTLERRMGAALTGAIYLCMDHHPSPHGSPIPKRSALPKVMKRIVSHT